jgi:DNA-binding transcriptional regulator YiaG
VTRRDLALIAETRAALADGSARARREAAHVRLREFAETLGRSHAAVSQWERALREPGAADALAYGRLLASLGQRAA